MELTSVAKEVQAILVEPVEVVWMVGLEADGQGEQEQEVEVLEATVDQVVEVTREDIMAIMVEEEAKGVEITTVAVGKMVVSLEEESPVELTEEATGAPPLEEADLVSIILGEAPALVAVDNLKDQVSILNN